MIEVENIDELLSKFFSGEASPEEAMLLEDWKADHPDNLNYFKKNEKVFALLYPGNNSSEPDSHSAWEKVKNKMEGSAAVIPLNRNKNVVWMIAAGITMLIGLGVLIFYVMNAGRQQNILYTAANIPREVKLTDGSQIAISPHSNISVDKDFGKKNRIVHLKGNADFSVIHEETLPFIVDAGDVFIRDIGTKFSIRSSVDTDSVFVRVDEGVVLLFDSLGSTLEIKATEKAVYIRSIKKIIAEQTITNSSVSSSLHFMNASLTDVILKLTGLYHTDILLENEQLGNCKITTQFNKENLEIVLGVITETLGLSYEKTSSGYLIKGQSCQPQ